MTRVRSNCVFWAVGRYIRLLREWEAAGSPREEEPGLHLRPSRLEPRKVCGLYILHWQVYRRVGGRLLCEEWVPIDKRPLRWWELWRALWAPGEIKASFVY